MTNVQSMNASNIIDIGQLEIKPDESRRAYLYFVSDNERKLKAEITRNVDVIELLRQGMRFETVQNIVKKTCVSRNELSDILHISVRQMNRYEPDSLLSTEQSGFVYEFSRLYVRGLDIFGDQETFEKWLKRPQMSFGMQTPLSLLDTSEGFRQINDLLSQIEYGYYS